MTTLGAYMTSVRQFLRCHDSRDASRGVMFALPSKESMIPRKPTLEELALSPIPDGLKCAACHLVYKEPCIALSCGHVSCKACILLKDGNGVQCPTCCKIFPAGSVSGCVAVNKQMIDHVKVRCLNGVSFDLAEGRFTAGGWIGGCQEEMFYGDQDKHLDECVKMPVRCRFEGWGCALVRGRGKIAEHEAVCPFRREKCRWCGNTVDVTEEHMATCYGVEVECPNRDLGCNFVGARGALAPHVKACPFVQVRPFFERQEEELKGLRARVSFLEEHSSKLVMNMEDRNAELMSYKTSYTKLEEETRRLRARVVEQSSHLAKMSAEVEEKNGRLYGQGEKLHLFEEQLDEEKRLSLEKDATCMALEEQVKELHVKMEKMENAEVSHQQEAVREAETAVLQAKLAELEGQNVALGKNMESLSVQNADLVAERGRAEKLETEVQSLRQRVALLQQQNLELEKERLGENDTRRVGGPQTPHGELERTSAREPERWQEESQLAGTSCQERKAEAMSGPNGSSKSSSIMAGCMEVCEGEGLHDFCQEGGTVDVLSEGRVEEKNIISAAAANGPSNDCGTRQTPLLDAELDAGHLDVMEGLMQLASGNWRMNGNHGVPAPACPVERDPSQLKERTSELERPVPKMEVQATGGRHVSGDSRAHHAEESRRRVGTVEADVQLLQRRVKELERQNFQQAQRVTDLVDQNARLATGNAKLSVVEREAKGLRERLEELEKQIKEMVSSEAVAERERGNLPRVPEWVEERVNRLVGGLPPLESSDKDEDAFRPRLAELARQNIELASQEEELKKQVHFLAERCATLERMEDEVLRLTKQVADLEKINHNLFQRNASLEGLLLSSTGCLWADAPEKALLGEKSGRDRRLVRGTRASNRRQKTEVKVEPDAGPSKVEKEEETAGLNQLCAVLQTTGSNQAEEEEETAGLNQLCAVLQLAEDDAGEATGACAESSKPSDKEVELVGPDSRKQSAFEAPVLSPRKRKAKAVEQGSEDKHEDGSQPKSKKQKEIERKNEQAKKQETERKNEQANGVPPALMTWGGVGESVKRRHAAPPVPPQAPVVAAASSKGVSSKLPASESKSGSSKQTSSEAKNGLSKAADFTQVLGPAYGGVGEAVKKRHARPPPGVVNNTATNGKVTNGKVSPVKRPAPPAAPKAASEPAEPEEKRRKKRKMVNSLVDKENEKEREKKREKELREAREEEKKDEGKLIIPEKGKRTPKESVKEFERCIRSDGRDWRCHRRRMDAEHQFCEAHYIQHKAKIERKHAKRVSVEEKKPVTKAVNKATASKGTGTISKAAKVISKSKKMKDDDKSEGPSRQCAFTGGSESWRCSKPAEFGMTHCKKHMAQGGKAIPWLAAAPAHKSGVKA